MGLGLNQAFRCVNTPTARVRGTACNTRHSRIIKASRRATIVALDQVYTPVADQPPMAYPSWD
jgi:hypothetical protein